MISHVRQIFLQPLASRTDDHIDFREKIFSTSVMVEGMYPTIHGSALDGDVDRCLNTGPLVSMLAVTNSI